VFRLFLTRVLAVALALFLATGATPAQSAPAQGSDAQQADKGNRLGVGFLIGRSTEPLVPLLEGDRDFLEMMLGPGKIRYIRALKPPVRALCICESLESVAKTVTLLREAEIGPERVYLAYNPEPRPPGARQCTPREELDDYLGSLQKARQVVKDYGAPLIMGPGLSEMTKREHLYPALAQHCDIWMIQTQRLQLDPQTGTPSSPQRYREEVKRIVGLLRRGNPGIRIFVQVIPLQATAERKAFFTAERVAAYVLAVADLVDSAKIYGGNAELIAEVVKRVRRGTVDAAGGKNTGSDAPPAREAPSPPQGGRGGPTHLRAPEPCAEKPAPQPVVPAEKIPSSKKQTIMLEMRDGARLATDLYPPVAAPGDRTSDRVPVVLIRTPYNKDGQNRSLERWRDCLVRNGYVFAVQDMRGFYASKDAGRTGPAQYDGYDTIEWLAQQPWCNGKVGMMGFSHLGAAQYEAAVTRPPHLACAIPAQAPANYYTDSLFPPKFRKADMETVLRGPFSSRTTAIWNTRIHRRDNSRIDQFNAPMLHSAGWYDFYKEGAIEMFRALQAHGGPGARGTQKLIIGPWGHGVLQEENPTEPLKLPGGLAYPANAKLNWEKEVWLPWFDCWLKGQATGVIDRPAVKYYLMGDVDQPQAPGNRWIDAEDFPPKSVAVPYYIHSDRTLSADAPAASRDSLRYEYDPKNPVPTVGRVHARLPVTGPHDQREVEGRPDVLAFTTPLLKTPLEIVGAVRVKLWASSDRKDTDFTVKLTDVYPDGRSMIFLDGIVKARYRNTYLKEEFLEPGQVYEFDVDLGYIAIAIAAGHRLRLAISSSNFDRWDINPNTGEPYGEHAVSQSLLATRLRVAVPREKAKYTESLVATNTVFLDAQHPTHVTLPLVSPPVGRK
jgi:putative CocE/NonD family hydrolase